MDVVNSVEIGWNFMEKFPQLITVFDQLKGTDYAIRLKPDAQPYALNSPRRIPVLLLSKVKEALSRMEKMQIISPVDGPTELCLCLISYSPKAERDVRLCVDLTQLNNGILREFHPVPSVDHTLAQLSGAKYFSKLDANSGF